MNCKHTPGPWHVAPGINGARYVASDGYGYIPIRTPFRADAFTPGSDNRSDHTDEELDANARLIAAAPALLSALQAVEWSGSEDLEEGGYAPACPCCGTLQEDGAHSDSCELAAALRLTIAKD